MDSNNQSLFELQIDQPVSGYLRETAKWAKFLAIVGFVFCGLLAVAAIFAGSLMATALGSTGSEGGMPAVFLTTLYLAGALIYFFPCLFLLHFANKMQRALRQNDQFLLTDSFKNLKSCYKYMGILMIIVLSLYIVGIMAAVFTATSSF